MRLAAFETERSVVTIVKSAALASVADIDDSLAFTAVSDTAAGQLVRLIDVQPREEDQRLRHRGRGRVAVMTTLGTAENRAEARDFSRLNRALPANTASKRKSPKL